MAEEMAQNLALARECTNLRGRGGKRQGERSRQTETMTVCVRISEAQHLRWNEVTTLTKLPSDNARSQVSSSLDLAAEFDEGSDR